MERLTGKVALITGAAKGIGLATAQRFVEEGAKVAITDVDEKAGKRAAENLGANAIFIQHDVRDEKQWQAAVKTVLKTFGKLNIVFNNAGIGDYINIEDMTADVWSKFLAINLTGVMWGNKYAVKAMKNNGEHNAIVNMSSMEGLIGEPELPAYNASKGGVRLLTKSVAMYCAQQGYDIRVNSVHPGYIMTPMMETLMDKDPQLKARLLAMHPMGRLGTPEEIANLVVFLASDESSFSTGSEFVADGGHTAG